MVRRVSNPSSLIRMEIRPCINGALIFQRTEEDDQDFVEVSPYAALDRHQARELLEELLEARIDAILDKHFPLKDAPQVSVSGYPEGVG